MTVSLLNVATDQAGNASVPAATLPDATMRTHHRPPPLRPDGTSQRRPIPPPGGQVKLKGPAHRAAPQRPALSGETPRSAHTAFAEPVDHPLSMVQENSSPIGSLPGASASSAGLLRGRPHTVSGEQLPWRPAKSWKPAGAPPTRMPYSQPWVRQGQVALDNCVKHIAELKSLLEVRTSERDDNLKLAQQTNELLTQVSRERNELSEELQATRLECDGERAKASAANAAAAALRSEGDQLRAELERMSTACHDAQKELHLAVQKFESCKAALERSTIEMGEIRSTSLLAEAQRAAAEALQSKMMAERAAEEAAQKEAERLAHEAEAMSAEETRRAEEERQRRALLALDVQDDTRRLIEAELERRIGSKPKRSATADGDDAGPPPSRYADPEEIFSLLESKDGARPSACLIRASWLRAKAPPFLPAHQSQLPSEALISASELRKIYRQIKGKQRLLPIISVLHAQSKPLTPNVHPDPDGSVLRTVCVELENRWDQFTRKRGTGGDSGVADLGVFFDWVSLDDGRTRTSLTEGFSMWYAHELISVWMLPEEATATPGAAAARSSRLEYSNGWANLEHRLATFSKSTSDLSGYSGPWPQLLDLSAGSDLEQTERVHRPSPAEPLAFKAGHEFGDIAYEGGPDERACVESIYQDTVIETLACSSKLIFNRLDWNDMDASRLALLLPLCSQVQELHLSCNNIGDQAVIMLTQTLGSLTSLSVLNLSSNRIGDSGASRLSAALTDGALRTSLKSLDLSTNHIGDKGALTLAAAISGGAIIGCKKVNMKGNPVSATAKKQVAKSLKKRK